MPAPVRPPQPDFTPVFRVLVVAFVCFMIAITVGLYRWLV